MALCEPAAHPFHDTMKSLHSSSAVFHQDDLWTACGGYEGLDDELSSMVSMVTSLQDTHNHPEAFTSGLHRKASFDSGSTSHDSDSTPSFSTGSPVTVLPPLPYSCSDGKDQESSYSQYADGLWTAAHGRATSDCDQMLAAAGGENFPSLLMNELPLRSYDDGVDQVCGSSDIDYQLDCMVTSSVSSHPSYQTSDNSRSTPESDNSHTGIESNFCGQEFLLGHEYGSDHNRNHPAHAVTASVNRSASPPRTNTAAAPVHVESEGARRRLSWTDNYWPASGTNPISTPASLNNFQSTTATPRLQLPQQFVNGFNNGANIKPASTFHDADYAATCIQYRKTQLQEITNAGGAVTNSLKRPYSTMQSACPNVASSSAAGAASHSFLKFGAANSKQQDAAALSALLYKNNHGSDLMQQLQAGASGSPEGSAAGGMRESIPPPKLRRRHGTATDPQSIAARTRRERFSDRIRLLQSLVPNGERLDTVSMLGHTLEYVRFLQHQVWQLYNGGDDASISQPDSESREKWKEFMDTQSIMS